MKEIQVYLVPQPGSKPEFLCKVRAVDPSPIVVQIWENKLPVQIVLEGYTRDGWAALSSTSTYQNVVVESIDGRNKLPGFLKYLRDRQKSCYGRMAGKSPTSPPMLMVVSCNQPTSVASHNNRMECRIALDMNKIQGCNLKIPRPQQQQQQKQRQPAPAAAAGAAGGAKKRSGGFLGKLVGAQHRTNLHVAAASAPTRSVAVAAGGGGGAAGGGGGDNDGAGPNGSNPSAEGAVTRTAQEVLAEFRQSMQDKMLDFDISPDETIEVEISLSDHTAGLSPEEKGRVTMEILKYMVYEAAEEVNEEWIAHKEPSEFMDEVVITVYKEGAAPEEVIEEMNQGELPDEIRGQQRAIQNERIRQAEQAESKKKAMAERAAHHSLEAADNGDEGAAVSALNTNKRDRRTIEDFEREKRARTS